MSRASGHGIRASRVALSRPVVAAWFSPSRASCSRASSMPKWWAISCTTVTAISSSSVVAVLAHPGQRAAEDRDPVGQRAGPGVAALGQRRAVVDAQQVGVVGGRLVLDEEDHVVEQPHQLRRHRVEGVTDRLLELRCAPSPPRDPACHAASPPEPRARPRHAGMPPARVSGRHTGRAVVGLRGAWGARGGSSRGPARPRGSGPASIASWPWPSWCAAASSAGVTGLIAVGEVEPRQRGPEPAPCAAVGEATPCSSVPRSSASGRWGSCCTRFQRVNSSSGSCCSKNSPSAVRTMRPVSRPCRTRSRSLRCSDRQIRLVTQNASGGNDEERRPGGCG